MSRFTDAVQDFVDALLRQPPPEVIGRLRQVMEAADGATPEEAGWALRDLVELLAYPHGPYPGLLALVCERCMGAGGDAWAAAGLIIEQRKRPCAG